MASSDTASSNLLKAKAVARKLAHQAGIKPGEAVGAEILIAGIAKAIGPDRAGELLVAAGTGDVAAFLAAIPDASPQETDRFPELKPDRELVALMRGGLAGFLAGQASGEEALKVLLEASQGNQRVRHLLADPKSLYRSREAEERYGTTKQLLRGLSAFYQPRFHLGYLYYTVDVKAGAADFTSGKKDRQFLEAVGDTYEKEKRAREGVFASRMYAASPLGRCASDFGEMEADILGVAILGEMGLVSHGPLSVRQVAWTLDPKNLHRTLGLARAKVTLLSEAGMLRLNPEEDTVRLYTQVLPSDAVLEEFLAFLRDADPLTAEDATDLVRVL